MKTPDHRQTRRIADSATLTTLVLNMLHTDLQKMQIIINQLIHTTNYSVLQRSEVRAVAGATQ